MDDFDTFKASREKMDPTSRKMSEHQWQQAYTAYRNARGRVAGGGDTDAKAGGQSSGSAKKRRHSKSKTAGRGAHRPSQVSGLALLRHKIRGQSAYADLRLIVDVLAWIAIGMVVLAGVLTLFYYSSVPATLASLMGTFVQVIGIVVARLLVQVLIDIPDVALYRLHQGSVERSQSALDSES